jgi:hypothetical protein
MTTFFGFAIADSMFPNTCTVNRDPLTLEEFITILKTNSITSCCNGSHESTVSALNSLLPSGVTIQIPETPPMVKLSKGDRIIVMSVRGLPRLTDNRHYTDEEINNASFVFGTWTVS